MGMTKWKSRETGEVVEVEFPLNGKVSFSDGAGEHELTRDGFLIAYTQDVPKLQPVNAQGFAVVPTAQTPGNPIGTPIAQKLDLTPLVDELRKTRESQERVEALLSKVLGEKTATTG